jgi:Na+/H+ antiporter NhaC
MMVLMEKADMTQGLSPIAAYMQTIPYIVYGWFTVLTVPLFAVGVLPLFGSMKKSESRALETGQVLSEISLKATTESQEEVQLPSKHRAVNFIITVVLLAAVTIIAKDILLGLVAALILCFALYIPQKLMKSGEYFALLIKGMVNMFPVVAIIVLAYTFRIINKELGLADFIINIILNYIPGVFLPVTIFVVMAFLSFATGTFWGMAVITFPIVECLAAVIGVNPFLCAGALISAVAFGGHICMYSDTVLLTSVFTEVTNYDYLKTSFPLVIVPFSLSVILYIILGFIIA